MGAGPVGCGPRGGMDGSHPWGGGIVFWMEAARARRVDALAKRAGAWQLGPGAPGGREVAQEDFGFRMWKSGGGRRARGVGAVALRSAGAVAGTDEGVPEGEADAGE